MVVHPTSPSLFHFPAILASFEVSTIIKIYRSCTFETWVCEKVVKTIAYMISLFEGEQVTFSLVLMYYCPRDLCLSASPPRQSLLIYLIVWSDIMDFHLAQSISYVFNKYYLLWRSIVTMEIPYLVGWIGTFSRCTVNIKVSQILSPRIIRQTKVND